MHVCWDPSGQTLNIKTTHGTHIYTFSTCIRVKRLSLFSFFARQHQFFPQNVKDEPVTGETGEYEEEQYNSHGLKMTATKNQLLPWNTNNINVTCTAPVFACSGTGCHVFIRHRRLPTRVIGKNGFMYISGWQMYRFICNNSSIRRPHPGATDVQLSMWTILYSLHDDGDEHRQQRLEFHTKRAQIQKEIVSFYHIQSGDYILQLSLITEQKIHNFMPFLFLGVVDSVLTYNLSMKICLIRINIHIYCDIK